MSTRLELAPAGAKDGAVEVLLDGPPPDVRDLVLLAHGAGSYAEHSTLAALAAALATTGAAVARFDFPYRRRGPDGERPRRPPDRMPRLVEAFRQVAAALVDAARPARLFLAGHSMGGRAAAHALVDPGEPVPAVAGVLLCAYPLHPPGRPERPRDEVLHALAARGVPMLWASGTRDPFCTPAVDAAVRTALGDAARHVRLEGADHGYEIPRRSGRTRDDALAELAAAFATWAARAPRRRKA